MDILSKIKKYYKNNELLLEIYLEKYHNFNIYIRLDYYKKMKVYRLSWFDITNLINYDIDKYISYEYIPDETINDIEKNLQDIKISKYEKTKDDEYKVTITSNFKDHNFNLIFNRYIPKDFSPLLNVVAILFSSLPKKLDCFLQEMGAEIVGNTTKFEYREKFIFDLFNDDLAGLFAKEVSEKGKKYYKEGRVFFLEKIMNSYYAIVGGKGLYVVVIDYDEKNKTMQMYCSCPCEFYCKHLYATIMAIRNKRFRNFYKIIPNNKKQELLDRIMNFNFLLTIGIDDQGNNYLVLENGQLKLLPVLNEHGKSDWVILEDDKNNTLTKRLDEIIK